MGAGAIPGITAAVQASSKDQLAQDLRKMDDAQRAKIAEALSQVDGSVSCAKPEKETESAKEAIEKAMASREAPEKAKPATKPADQAKPAEKAKSAPAEEVADGDIPASWGWPKEPIEPEELKEYVKEKTKNTSQEEWSAALQARTEGEAIQDHAAEKVFANVCLNKEGTGDAKADEGIDPNAYLAGKWYRFLNANEDCYVYIHNYTKDITATKPDNFKELTDEEKKRLKQLGTYIKELPQKIDSVYNKIKCIPIIFASQETCEALKNFFLYDKGGELCDTSKLKRINAKGLEECRKAIVNAMKLGKTLCVYLGDHICEFEEKVCIAKNRNSFPDAVFRYGGLDNEKVKENIYTEEDKEGGQCVVRPGFKVCLVLMYDSMNFDMSSFRKEEMQKIPLIQHMEELRTYNEDDKKRFLAQQK
eukprot:gnl/MRDRNA2_/MRDRNA2_97111_c0_seq1.p1 gnl/MRDRNA2_/MRDRNA2_97111_c0~~gnl/MRDRNA2_/MRDRNA2_97111_c0_seq1.p1  ORF type:complete len:420 (-),score=110.43 gnl/MRDRNA2_/MRDRNA2_97111_c0_seq1:40-1299(-)